MWTGHITVIICIANVSRLPMHCPFNVLICPDKCMENVHILFIYWIFAEWFLSIHYNQKLSSKLCLWTGHLTFILSLANVSRLSIHCPYNDHICHDKWLENIHIMYIFRLFLKCPFYDHERFPATVNNCYKNVSFLGGIDSIV